MYNNLNYQQTILLRYLNQYLSKKNLKMKPIVQNIKSRVEKNQPITFKQFKSLIKFIEREPEFRGSSKNEIFEFFEPLLERKVISYGNDLSEHLI